MSLQGLCGPISILVLMKTLYTHRASDMLLRDVCAYHNQVFILQVQPMVCGLRCLYLRIKGVQYRVWGFRYLWYWGMCPAFWPFWLRVVPVCIFPISAKEKSYWSSSAFLTFFNSAFSTLSSEGRFWDRNLRDLWIPIDCQYEHALNAIYISILLFPF